MVFFFFFLGCWGVGLEQFHSNQKFKSWLNTIYQTKQYYRNQKFKSYIYINTVCLSSAHEEFLRISRQKTVFHKFNNLAFLNRELHGLWCIMATPVFSHWVVSTGISIAPTLKANGGTTNFGFSIAVEEIGVRRHSTARKCLHYFLEQALVSFWQRKIKREIC